MPNFMEEKIPPQNLNGHVLVFGTFDLLHPGHRSFLRQARRFGKELTVVVARDHNVEKLKGHLPSQDQETRLNNVARLPFVTKVILGQEDLQHRYKLIKEINPDVIALGYDQYLLTLKLQEDLKTLGLTTQVVRLKAYRPDIYKSSAIRSTLGV